GLARRQRHDVNASAPGTYLRRADDGLLAIIAPLHEHVRPQLHDQLEWCVLLEHDHTIDALERGDDVRALRLTAHGTCRTLEPAHGGVAVDRHDEMLSGSPCTGEDVDVARMYQVEDAV